MKRIEWDAVGRTSCREWQRWSRNISPDVSQTRRNLAGPVKSTWGARRLWNNSVRDRHLARHLSAQRSCRAQILHWLSVTITSMRVTSSSFLRNQMLVFGHPQDESLNTRRAFDAKHRYSYMLKRAFRFLSTKPNERRE
jgi:hypothetical protein